MVCTFFRSQPLLQFTNPTPRLDAFMAACQGCTIDGVAIHWYGGWIDDFKSFVESAKKYNRPIYLSGRSSSRVSNIALYHCRATEFGFEWDQYATVDSFMQFLPLAFGESAFRVCTSFRAR